MARVELERGSEVVVEEEMEAEEGRELLSGRWWTW